MARSEQHALADEAATIALGRRIAAGLRGGELLLLSGDLGAGKTTLVRGLAEGLGCEPADVSSPTFVSLQPYEGERLTLVHVDAYRRSSMESMGLADWLGRGDAVVVIEWPDRLQGLEATGAIEILLQHDPDGRAATVIDPR